MLSYLEELTIRLATGTAALPEEVRRLHGNFVLQQQRADGGFAGREGDSDLYYTGFGLRSLSILGELYGEVAERAAAFLRGRLTGRESIVDFLSLMYSAALLEISAGIDIFSDAQDGWRDNVADAMEKLRRDDGGYAKGAEGAASSTYHTFLVTLCLQLLERPIPQPADAVRFVLSQRAEGGGFHEMRASKRAGANPTAAAIGLLRIHGDLTEEICDETIDFLLEMETDEGGLRANTRIPFADLLSTFTAIVTLGDLQALHELQLPLVQRYINSLAIGGGGFHGAALDPATDVEYTFYGIGSLALLHAPTS